MDGEMEWTCLFAGRLMWGINGDVDWTGFLDDLFWHCLDWLDLGLHFWFSMDSINRFLGMYYIFGSRVACDVGLG